MTSTKGVERFPARKLSKLPRFVSAPLIWFALPRIKKATACFVDVRSKLKLWTLEVQQDTDPELIDPSLHNRDALQALKASLKKQRDEMRVTHENIAVIPEIQEQFKILLDVMGEVYEVTTQLQWELAEHDASRSANVEGFVASSADELDALLQRISVGA